jgi:AraC-like DNA-binding protein
MARRLKRILDWKKRADTANYALSKLKDNCGANARQLRRQLVEQYGITTQVWLNLLKAQAAVRMLLEGEQVKCISPAIGFKHVASFFEILFELGWADPRQFLQISSSEQGC